MACVLMRYCCRFLCCLNYYSIAQRYDEHDENSSSSSSNINNAAGSGGTAEATALPAAAVAVREKRSPLAPLPLLRWEATLLSHLEAAFELQWCTVGRSGGDPETVSSSAAAASTTTSSSSSSSSSSSAVQLRRQGTLKPPVRRVGVNGSIREGGLPPGSRPQGGGSAVPYVAQCLAPLMLPELRLA
eukprot:7262-Heterococcus_DN1.PRE.1